MCLFGYMFFFFFVVQCSTEFTCRISNAAVHLHAELMLYKIVVRSLLRHLTRFVLQGGTCYRSKVTATQRGDKIKKLSGQTTKFGRHFLSGMHALLLFVICRRPFLVIVVPVVLLVAPGSGASVLGRIGEYYMCVP